MRKPKVLTSAFTLLELLTVIAIILILSAIILGVSMQGVKSAKLTTCISNLRSIGQAVELYSSDNNNRLPDNIYINYDAIVHYSKEKVFQCPVDQAPFAFQGAPTVTTTPSSYFPLPTILEGFEEELRSKDKNFTVFVCLLHGRHERTVRNPLTDMSGLVLRLRIDSSVTKAHVGKRCWTNAEGVVLQGRDWWHVFSDLEPSQAVLDQVTGVTGAYEVPCVDPL